VAEHGDLCFGCGNANLFGLQLELERLDGGVTGRFFVKQDHQGPDGSAHPGVLMAALEEAMAQTAGRPSERIDMTVRASAPVGSFVRVTGWVEVDGSICAAASTERGELLAEAAAVDAGAPTSSLSLPPDS
jgi:acyl-coenzyme A thioesterase PaaI-like protein